MKKGAILLMTLFFIVSISILILKNLSDTNSYLIEQNSKFTKTEILYYTNNLKDEVLKVLKNIEQREDLYKYLGITFPFNIKDANISIRLEEYDKYDINLLKSKDEKNYLYLSEFLKQNGIYNIYTIQEILNEQNSIKNRKQLNYIFKKFNQESYSNDIQKVENYIGFIKYDKKDFSLAKEDKDILFYELFIKINYLQQNIDAYYILKKEPLGVEYFEYSFR